MRRPGELVFAVIMSAVVGFTGLSVAVWAKEMHREARKPTEHRR